MTRVRDTRGGSGFWCAVLWILAAGPGWAQDGAPAEGSGPDTAALTPQVILERATRAQGSPPRREGDDRLRLSADMDVHLEGDGKSVFLEAHYRFLSPHYIRTEVYEDFSDTRTVRAFDGERGWLTSNKEKGVTWFDGPDYQADRQALKDEMRKAELFAEIFFLENLVPRLENPRRLDDVAHAGKEAYVVEGQITRKEAVQEEVVSLRLYLEKQTDHLYGVEVRSSNPQQPSMRICFWGHEKDDHGIVMPGKIEVYYHDEDKPRETIHGIRVDFSAKLTPGDFQAPQ